MSAAPAPSTAMARPIISIATPDGRDGSVTIHQDAAIYATLLDGDERVAHDVANGRRAYVHVARGSVAVDGERLGAGDAVKLDGGARIVLSDGDDAEVLLFDLP